MMQRSVIALVLTCWMLLGCRERLTTDLSAKPAYREVVGSRYEIVADLVAYGVKRDLQKGAEYVTLIPPPGISGPELAFTIPIVRGSEVTVLKVMQSNRWADADITLLVRLAGTRLPIEHEIRVDLYRGNEGAAGVLLNPKIYRKLAP